MSFFSLNVRPFFRTLGVIATCFWLTFIIAYVADRLTARSAPVRRDSVAVATGTRPEETERARIPTEKEIAEGLDYELYGTHPYRIRLRVLMGQGDGALLSDFRTDFMDDFKAFFGARVCTEKLAEPDSSLIVSAVLGSLREILSKDGVARNVTDADFPGNLDNLPHRAYALYLKSLNTDRDRGITLMDELLALPAEERLTLNAIAKYRRARLSMSREDWSEVSDADAKARLRSIREDLTSVAQHAREGSLDPAKISENAAYWIAYSRSMMLTTERLVRLGEADYAGAVEAYLRMPRRGSANAVNSCLWLAHKLCLDGYFEAAVSEPDVRLLVTLFLTAGGGNSAETYLPDDLVKQRRLEWLDALARAKVDPAFAPGHVALLQYASGRWADCRKTTEQMPRDDALRGLLLARCQLRTDGDLSAARRLLAPGQVSSATKLPAPKPPGPITTEFELTTLISVPEQKELRARVQGELGLHALANGDFLTALSCFEAGGYGTEALYVAECLLTLDELKGYVDARRKAKKPLLKFESRWMEPFDDLEQELASRLMRVGLMEEALAYVDPNLRPKATNYVLMLRGAERTDLDARSQADAYWRCALLIRELGETILHAPYGQSWTSSGGWHVGYGYFPRLRLGLPQDEQPLPSMKWVGAGAEEKKRLSAWQSQHIDTPDLSERDARYAAYRHALQAARLLPDNDPAGAEILQYAGNLLKYREPKAAVPAYRLLVTRFSQTPYGQHAVTKKWFSSERPEPPADLLSK